MPVESIKVTQKKIEVTVKSTGQKITVASPKVQIVTAGKIGPSGPVGPQGAAGTPRIEVPFSFGDATPLVLFTAIAGKLIERITVFVELAFDGEVPSLTIGDEDSPTLLMNTSENDPTEEAAYQVTPNFFYESDTQVLLFISPGLGASQGSGLIVAEMQT